MKTQRMKKKVFVVFVVLERSIDLGATVFLSEISLVKSHNME